MHAGRLRRDEQHRGDLPVAAARRDEPQDLTLPAGQRGQDRAVAALFRGPAGDWQAFVVEDGVARLRSLEIGLLNDEQAEVVKGLDENAVVILAPETNLVDGARVQPVIP